MVQTEAVRHIKEEHARETFQCKLCLAADPACFPYAETIKEMTGHMVLKHKDVSEGNFLNLLILLQMYRLRLITST